MLGKCPRFVSGLLIVLASLTTQTASADTVIDRIASLTEDKRRLLFARMLTSSGERCSSVSRTFFQGTSRDGAGFWSVACIGGHDWQVMVGNDSGGSTKIAECARRGQSGPRPQVTGSFRGWDEWNSAF